MGNDNIQNLVTEVFAIEDSGQQIKLRDKNKRSLGSFFKTKKDGESTVAFKQFQDMEIKSGSVVEISFKEVSYKDGVIKNIIGFREAMGRPVERPVAPQKAPGQAQTYKAEEQPKDDKFWDKKAFKQCLWGYWLERYPDVLFKAKSADGTLGQAEMDLVWQVFTQIEADADKRFSEIDAKDVPF